MYINQNLDTTYIKKMYVQESKPCKVPVIIVLRAQSRGLRNVYQSIPCLPIVVCI